jgi:hypothetical protein
LTIKKTDVEEEKLDMLINILTKMVLNLLALTLIPMEVQQFTELLLVNTTKKK